MPDKTPDLKGRMNQSGGVAQMLPKAKARNNMVNKPSTQSVYISMH